MTELQKGKLGPAVLLSFACPKRDVALSVPIADLKSETGITILLTADQTYEMYEMFKTFKRGSRSTELTYITLCLPASCCMRLKLTKEIQG